jgi:hypothetical protein
MYAWGRHKRHTRIIAELSLACGWVDAAVAWLAHTFVLDQQVGRVKS